MRSKVWPNRCTTMLRRNATFSFRRTSRRWTLSGGVLSFMFLLTRLALFSCHAFLTKRRIVSFHARRNFETEQQVYGPWTSGSRIKSFSTELPMVSTSVIKDGIINHSTTTNEKCIDGEDEVISYLSNRTSWGERRVNIRSVDWSGSKGMIPWQRYYGLLADFDSWLIRPLGGTISSNWELDSTHLMNQSSDVDVAVDTRFESPSTGSTRSRHQQRLRKKQQAERRASLPLTPSVHLKPIFVDPYLVAVHKPSGILCVPGPRRNPSIANLVHEHFGNESNDVDKMVVHRLDMDTSGVVVFARTDEALKLLHKSFKLREVRKKYEALLCGWLSVPEGEIDLPLVRDAECPPFMRVATATSISTRREVEASLSQRGLLEGTAETKNKDALHVHSGYVRMMSKAPKPSLTTYEVLSLEYLKGYPVTRVALSPMTGRTHQLRVHCAAIGHPIVGDDIYGYNGEGSPNGGLSNSEMDAMCPSRAGTELQQQIHRITREKYQHQQKGEAVSKHTHPSPVDGGTGVLCLHARQLSIYHPYTMAPMVFEIDAPF